MEDAIQRPVCFAEYPEGSVPCAVPECACDAHCFPEPNADQPEESANIRRLGIGMAEADTLYQQGWNVRMRYDEQRATLTAVIGRPPFNAATQYTILALPNGIGKYAIGRACRIARLDGNPVSWDRPLQMTDGLWLAFFLAWRDHFDGELPSGWPLPARAS